MTLTTHAGGVLSALFALLSVVVAMALRKRTGEAAKYGHGEPLVVVPPVDEIRNADGPARRPAITRPVKRRSGGQIDGPEAARALAERAVAARREKRARADALATRVRMTTSLPGFAAHSYFVPYAEEAEAALGALLTQLGQQSDGVVTASVSSIARSSVMQTYGGRFIFDLATGALAFADEDGKVKATPNAGLLLQASRLLEAGRQSHIAAFHLQQLEAEARAARPGGQHGALPGFVITEGEDE